MSAATSVDVKKEPVISKLDAALKVIETLKNPGPLLQLGTVVSTDDEPDTSEDETSEINEDAELKQQIATSLYEQLGCDSYMYAAQLQVPAFDVIHVNGKPLPKDGSSLFEMGKPSAFGDLKTATTRIDEKVRLAREIPVSKSDLTHDGKMLLKFLERTLKTTTHMFGYESVTIVPYKLNIYPPGGHFARHQDTPNPANVGSLVIELPYKRTGGDLVVDNGAGKNTKNPLIQRDVDSGKNVRVAVFYSNCPHEVTKVETGHRVTVACRVVKRSCEWAEVKEGRCCSNHSGCVLTTREEHIACASLKRDHELLRNRYVYNFTSEMMAEHDAKLNAFNIFQAAARFNHEMPDLKKWLDDHKVEHWKPKPSFLGHTQDVPEPYTVEECAKLIYAGAYPTWNETKSSPVDGVVLFSNTPEQQKVLFEQMNTFMTKTKGSIGILLSNEYSYDELKCGTWKMADAAFMGRIAANDQKWELQILPVIVRRTGEGRKVDETVYRMTADDYHWGVSKSGDLAPLPKGAPDIEFFTVRGDRKTIQKEEDAGAEHTGNDSRESSCDNTYYQVAAIIRLVQTKRKGKAKEKATNKKKAKSNPTASSSASAAAAAASSAS